MNELEEIRAKKLQELQQGQMQEELALQQQIQQLETIAKQLFTKEALERYGNVKAAHPEKAMQVLAIIGHTIQTGKIDKIDDDKLKELLQKLTPQKKEFNLKFK